MATRLPGCMAPAFGPRQLRSSLFKTFLPAHGIVLSIVPLFPPVRIMGCSMGTKTFILAAVLLMLAIVASAGCTGTLGTADTAGTPGTPDGGVPGSPPAGEAGDGSSPGGQPGSDSGSSQYVFGGTYTVDGETAIRTNERYTSGIDDVSAVYVTNGGNLTLVNATITTSGNTSSADASSFYGLNGAVLVNNGSTVTMTGGSISTTGSGANGAIPTGSGSSILLTNVTVTATGDGGHGVMATQGATLTLVNVDIATTGPHGAPIATDRGSGTVTVTGGTVTATGTDSPGIYSTGSITVADANITATGPEAAVIEGSNSITLTNTTLAGGNANTGGVMIYQSFSGDASVGTGTFTMTGGTLSGVAGPLFFVTNTNAVIVLTGVDVAVSSGTLVNASATTRWGTAGSNGGNATFIADSTTLAGDVLADNISSVAVGLRNGSTLTGSVNPAFLTLGAASTWNVTGDSVLTGLSDPDGISGTTITNIVGNGHTVTYDAGLAANSALGGKIYTLANGGSLVPR